jgi:hypothetical protein
MGGFARHARAIWDRHQAPTVLGRTRTRARQAMPAHRGRAHNRARSTAALDSLAGRATDESMDAASAGDRARGGALSGTASTREGGAGRGAPAERRSVAGSIREDPADPPTADAANAQTNVVLRATGIARRGLTTLLRSSCTPGSAGRMLPAFEVTSTSSGGTDPAWASVPECPLTSSTRSTAQPRAMQCWMPPRARCA